LTNVLFADDTLVMLENLEKLGFAADRSGSSFGARRGTGGQVPASSAELFCLERGTTIRVLTALCAVGRGSFTLDGIPRLRQRRLAR